MVLSYRTLTSGSVHCYLYESTYKQENGRYTSIDEQSRLLIVGSESSILSFSGFGKRLLSLFEALNKKTLFWSFHSYAFMIKFGLSIETSNTVLFIHF